MKPEVSSLVRSQDLSGTCGDRVTEQSLDPDLQQCFKVPALSSNYFVKGQLTKTEHYGMKTDPYGKKILS